MSGNDSVSSSVRSVAFCGSFGRYESPSVGNVSVLEIRFFNFGLEIVYWIEQDFFREYQSCRAEDEASGGYPFVIVDRRVRMSSARFIKRMGNGKDELTDENVKKMTARSSSSSSASTAPERIKSKVDDGYRKSAQDVKTVKNVADASAAKNRAALEKVAAEKKAAEEAAMVRKVSRTVPEAKAGDSPQVEELKKLVRQKEDEIQALLKKVVDLTERLDHVVRILDPQK